MGEKTIDEKEKAVTDSLAIDLHATTDADVWATEFFKLFPDTAIATGEGVLTGEDAHDLLRGWFANAITAGEIAANSRVEGAVQ